MSFFSFLKSTEFYTRAENLEFGIYFIFFILSYFFILEFSIVESR